MSQWWSVNWESTAQSSNGIMHHASPTERICQVMCIFRDPDVNLLKIIFRNLFLLTLMQSHSRGAGVKKEKE
jgi:hypothetical protein